MQSINEIKEILSHCPMDALPAQMQEWEGDSRKGVQNVLTSFRKKYERHLQELARLEEILTYERGCWAAGYALVAGIDEVGRGPLAGPVVAAAVILPQECKIEGVNDSKRLSAKKFHKAGSTDGGNDFQTRSGRGIKKCCKIIFAMILQHFL